MNDNEIIQQYKKYEPFFGSWYIKRFVGEGGFAKVFEIVRNDFGSEYVSALKIISVSKTKTEIDSMRNEGMSERDIKDSLYGIVEDTVREIQLMYKLRGNGNIVGYEDHSVIEHEDGLGWDILIKMEFLTSLGGYTRQNRGQISKRDVIKLGIDICKALEACQKYNIIHRDIKADNIFVSNNGDFKLGDFGIARVIERKDMELSKKGTFTYMAPEVYKGQPYTSSVDIYSLGMVLYRLMNNNRAPFLPAYPNPVSLDDRDKALMQRMSGEKLPKPNQMNENRLVEIAVKACAFRPEDRYSSPRAMRQDLESILYDRDEMTNDVPIMIYEDQGQDSSFSFSKSVPSGPKNEDGAAEVLTEDGATEILESDEATEVLRDDKAVEGLESDGATEILREGPSQGQAQNASAGNTTEQSASAQGAAAQSVSVQSAPAQDTPAQSVSTQGAPSHSAVAAVKDGAIKVLCKNCGQPINRGAEFCPFCGSSQKQSAPVVEEKEKKGLKNLLAKLPKKTPLIAGISAAVLVLGVVIAVVVTHLSSDDESEEPNRSLAEEFVDPTLEPIPTADPKPWLKNILMEVEIANDDEIPEETDPFLGTDILRWEIKTVTFLDSLSNKPDNAWDVSADGNGRVMAWAELTDGGYYDFFIAGDGGISANENSQALFINMTKLEEIRINDCFYTENVEDMSGMFFFCTELKTVDVSGFDTSKVVDMNTMFGLCMSLTELDVSGFDTANVKDMSYMFNYCSSLAALDVSGFNTSKVADMSYMFEGCISLAGLDVSSFNTSSVRDMNSMFYNCNSLTRLATGGFDTSNVTDMYYMFGECTSLTSVDVSGFNTSKVIDMEGMFMNCASLTGLNVSSFDTSKVTTMYAMFYNCSSLTSLDVSGFDTSKVTDMSYMFGQCTNVTYLDVSGFDTSSVTEVEGMFVNCTKLTGLNLDHFDSAWMPVMGVAMDQVASQDEEFADYYHEDFTAAWQSAGYQSRGWHETFTYASDPGMALHIVYFDPRGSLVRESGFFWEGPVMDVYDLEEEMRLNLYQEQNGRQIARLRILPLDLDGDLRNLDMEDIADLFEARLVDASVVEDSSDQYWIRCEVKSSWGNGSSGLIYAIQDYSTGFMYMYEYVVLDSLYFDNAPIDQLLQTMTPVDLEESGIDKETGLL